MWEILLSDEGDQNIHFFVFLFLVGTYNDESKDPRSIPVS